MYSTNNSYHKVNILKAEILLHKNLFHISQRTLCPSVIHSIRCVLNGKVISVYCENHTELINTPRGQNAHYFTVRPGDMYINHKSL